MSGFNTKKWLGLDNNVWLTMMTIILVSSLLVGYNYRSHKVKLDCKPLKLFVDGHINTERVIFVVGKPIQFRSYFTSEDKVIWNFRDGTDKVEALAPLHIFQKEGLYTITVWVNGCEYPKQILVKSPLPVKADSLEYISGPDRGFVGDKLVFSSWRAATRYEWFIENDFNTNTSTQTVDSASFTFQRPGRFTIVLVLDGNRENRLRKDVYIERTLAQQEELTDPIPRIPPVQHSSPATDTIQEPPKPAPVPTSPPPRVLRDVTNEQMKIYLQAIVCENTPLDFFESYLAEGIQTPISENRRDTQTFESLYNRLRRERVRIESVTATRNDGGIIVRINVNTDRRSGWLARNPCRN